jgi:hypothetical protein
VADFTQQFEENLFDGTPLHTTAVRNANFYSSERFGCSA